MPSHPARGRAYQRRQRSADGPATGRFYRPAALYVALGTVIVSLIVLMVAPVIVQREIEQLHDQIDLLTDPAAEYVREARYYVAREMSLARGWALSGDRSIVERFQEMRDSATAALDAFPPAAADLSPTIAGDLGAARARLESWHDALTVQDLLMRVGDPAADSAARESYGDALLALEALSRSIESTAIERRSRIRDAERLQITTTVLLGLLALVSAALVFWLVRRVRRLAWRAERERRASVEAGQARERLIRGVSHDLKNPLSVIDGYAELLEMGLKGELSSDQRQIVQRMRAAVASLLTTVQELVELSSAQAGLLRIEQEPVPMAPLLRELGADYASVAEAAGLQLQLRPLPDLPSARGDDRRTRQILENLIGNAIKYTPQGGSVTVSAEQRSDGPIQSPTCIAVHVADTGPGIPADRQRMVFDEFVRLENATGTSGSGIGLTMAQSLAALMGGRITVQSEPGAGAVFTLWLPLHTQD